MFMKHVPSFSRCTFLPGNNDIVMFHFWAATK